MHIVQSQVVRIDEEVETLAKRLFCWPVADRKGPAWSEEFQNN